ncbi:MAG: AbrB/MazE/SpoVT family DNA-binding domain-containing protein [Marmoricola sp.]
MKTTIDGAGRVVVPKAMRQRLGIDGPAEVEIELRDGTVEIRPQDRRIELVTDAEGRSVFRAPPGTPRLTAQDVRRVLEETREWPRG